LDAEVKRQRARVGGIDAKQSVSIGGPLLSEGDPAEAAEADQARCVANNTPPCASLSLNVRRLDGPKGSGAHGRAWSPVTFTDVRELCGGSEAPAAPAASATDADMDHAGDSVLPAVQRPPADREGQLCDADTRQCMTQPQCPVSSAGGRLIQDATDGLSYCSSCWLRHYGVELAAECTVAEEPLALAKETLEAHRVYAPLVNLNKRLRAALNAVATKSAREAMAERWCVAGKATRESRAQPALTGSGLVPANRSGEPMMQQGAAFCFTGVLAPVDIADAHDAGAVIAQRATAFSKPYFPFGERDELSLGDHVVLRPKDAEALRFISRPERIEIPDDSSGSNDHVLLCQFISDPRFGNAFSIVLAFLPPKIATFVSTAVCRTMRLRSSVRFKSYCRIFMQQAAADITPCFMHVHNVPNHAGALIGDDHVDRGEAEQLSAEVMKAKALCLEVTPLCLADLCEEDPRQRLQKAMETLRKGAEMKDGFRVQINAPDGNKLRVAKQQFQSLSPADQLRLITDGIVQQTQKVSLRPAAIRVTHGIKPAEAPITDVDVPTQLARCQHDLKKASALLDDLKSRIRTQWAEGTKVVVPNQGLVNLGRRTVTGEVTRFKCPGGQEVFKQLSVEDQMRLEPAFRRPGTHLRVDTGGGRATTANMGGRALMFTSASGSRAAGPDAACLPTHCFASRNWQPAFAPEESLS
jgi:hypothetical protein